MIHDDYTLLLDAVEADCGCCSHNEHTKAAIETLKRLHDTEACADCVEQRLREAVERAAREAEAEERRQRMQEADKKRAEASLLRYANEARQACGLPIRVSLYEEPEARTVVNHGVRLLGTFKPLEIDRLLTE